MLNLKSETVGNQDPTRITLVKFNSQIIAPDH